MVRRQYWSGTPSCKCGSPHAPSEPLPPLAAGHRSAAAWASCSACWCSVASLASVIAAAVPTPGGLPALMSSLPPRHPIGVMALGPRFQVPAAPAHESAPRPDAVHRWALAQPPAPLQLAGQAPQGPPRHCYLSRCCYSRLSAPQHTPAEIGAGPEGLSFDAAQSISRLVAQTMPAIESCCRPEL